MTEPKKTSHQRLIDKTVKAMLKGIATEPMEVRVKIIAQAINWEKVKNHIKGDDGDFDPESL
jgi:hypothetical protein